MHGSTAEDNQNMVALVVRWCWTISCERLCVSVKEIFIMLVYGELTNQFYHILTQYFPVHQAVKLVPAS